MASGIPYKQAKLPEAWDAIVIGSGIGGLTAAVLLGVHAGKRVLVLERHYEAGGFTHTFHRPGIRMGRGSALHRPDAGRVRRSARIRPHHGRKGAMAVPAEYVRPLHHRRPHIRVCRRTGALPRRPPEIVSRRIQGHRPISRSGSSVQSRERPLLCGEGGSGACGGAGR